MMFNLINFSLIIIIIIIIIIVNLHQAVNCNQATIERIRKHQEWLKQRQQRRHASIQTMRISTEDPTTVLMNTLQTLTDTDDSLPMLHNIDKDNRSLNVGNQTDEAIMLTTLASPNLTNGLFSTLPSNIINNRSHQRQTIGSNHFESRTTSTAANELSSVPLTTAAFEGWNTTEGITLRSIDTRIVQQESNQSRNTKGKIRDRIYPHWSNWSKWSPCSRPCGGGVSHQIRRCITRNSSFTRTQMDCSGIYKRYKLCNDQPCFNADHFNFRDLQCQSFNRRPFHGQFYNWQSYIKDDAECELNCKPYGERYFATLSEKVIDGTACSHPAEYYRFNYNERSICINGICRAVYGGGVIREISSNSATVSCGGLLCRPFTGIFTREQLPEDAYVHITTIPMGASNITITELKNSQNLLVLRVANDFVFNGENRMSESRSYEAAGTTFDYHRIDGIQHSEGVTEWITSVGPVREPVELLIFSRTINPGVKYEYLLPITSDVEENEISMENDGLLRTADDELTSAGNLRRRRLFQWKVMGFSPCTKSCGGGTQTPIVRCVRDHPLRFYLRKRCIHLQKPIINENLFSCNTQPCPAYWRLDDWSDCRCHQNDGYKERDVHCMQELTTGIVIHVDDSTCAEEKPPSRKACDCPKNRRRSHLKYRIHGGVTPNISHSYIRPAIRDKAGVWLMSDWNQFCSAECGTGVEYRTVFCDRSKSSLERCDVRITPENKRICQSEKECLKGDWFMGPWSSCNGNCFNLTRSRRVFCINNQLIVDESDCDTDLKPQTIENCLHTEVEYCGPKWHYSDWSDCTKSCDGGTQRRSVKCLEYDEEQNALKESQKCRYSLREPIYRSCNTHKCQDARLEDLQNDVKNACLDEFSNCSWVIKANLCNYEYYQQNCCSSCNSQYE